MRTIAKSVLEKVLHENEGNTILTANYCRAEMIDAVYMAISETKKALKIVMDDTKSVILTQKILKELER